MISMDMKYTALYWALRFLENDLDTHTKVYHGYPITIEAERQTVDYGKEITVLHLNDNDTLTDQHKMPLSGSMNWNDIFDALDEIGYDGIYNMELNLAFYGSELVVDTAQFAVKVLRRFLDARYGD